MYLRDKLELPAEEPIEAINRRNFVALLRDRTKWPASFYWDYGMCGRCAIGLFARVHMGLSATDVSYAVVNEGDTRPFTRELWSIHAKDGSSAIVRHLGLDPSHARFILFSLPEFTSASNIADAIERAVLVPYSQATAPG